MTDPLSATDCQLYENEIRRLQENISGLRMSRRILMSLLEQSQLHQQEESAQLLRENHRLKQQASLYVDRLWEKNRRIMELEQRLR
ncbi:MAG: translation initiation factor 2 [Clostridiales bacterium]